MSKTTKLDDGGNAFPVCTNPGELIDSPGISMLDYFAAAALTGYLASHAVENMPMPSEQEAAEQAYCYAQAMLEARSKLLTEEE